MQKSISFLLLALAALLFTSASGATNNVSVLVTAVDGRVRLEGEGAAKTMLEAFMRLNTGDRLNLPPGGKAVLVYIVGGRLEDWRGDGTLLIGRSESQAIEGKPALLVRQLPPEVSQQMNRTPATRGNRVGMIRLAEADSGQTMARSRDTRAAEVSSSARNIDIAAAPPAAAPAAAPRTDGPVGMARLRSITPPPSTSSALEKLEARYRQLRSETAGSDLTPEIFFLAGLFELREFLRLESELQRLANSHPDDPIAAALRATYAEAMARPTPEK